MRRIEGDRDADDYDETYEASALDGPDLDPPVAGPGDDDDPAVDYDGRGEGYDDDLEADGGGDLVGGAPVEGDGEVRDGAYEHREVGFDEDEDEDGDDGYDDRHGGAAAPLTGAGPPVYSEEPVGAPPEVGAYLPMLAEQSTLGPRQARLAGQRRRRRTTTVALLSAGGVLLAVALLLPFLTRGQGQTSAAATGDQLESAAPGPSLPSGPVVTRTVLLIGYGEEGGPARSTTLLSATSDGSAGSVVFLPPGLLLEIPGIGLDRLSQAQRFDGSDLVAETVESALGVPIDDYVALSEAGLASLLERVGGFSVFVGDQPLVGREEEGVSPVRIEAGQQELSGEQMAVYFDLLAEGESPVDSFPRQQQVLSALLAKIAADPDALDRMFSEGAAEFEGNGDPDSLREVLEELAAAQRNEQLTYEGLPVEPFGAPTAGTVTTYRTEADTGDFLDSLLPEESG